MSCTTHSFPRSAWERTSGRSASRTANRATHTSHHRHGRRTCALHKCWHSTRSVPTYVPTRSVGTSLSHKTMSAHDSKLNAAIRARNNASNIDELHAYRDCHSNRKDLRVTWGQDWNAARQKSIKI